MAGLAFDTLDASKTLRNAGVDERTADAIVNVVRRTTELPDVSGLLTKAEVRAEVAGLATAEELRVAVAGLATKAELAEVKAELKLDIAELRGEVRRIAPELKADLSERMRVQLFATLGYMTALIGAAVAVLKFVR